MILQTKTLVIQVQTQYIIQHIHHMIQRKDSHVGVLMYTSCGMEQEDQELIVEI